LPYRHPFFQHINLICHFSKTLNPFRIQKARPMIRLKTKTSLSSHTKYTDAQILQMNFNFPTSQKNQNSPPRLAPKRKTNCTPEKSHKSSLQLHYIQLINCYITVQ
jgi:hypothetical protein